MDEIENKISRDKKERKKSWNKKEYEYEEKSEENIFLEEGKEDEKNKMNKK